MPFQSEKQRRYLWANEPEIARDWTDTYGSRVRKQGGGIIQQLLMKYAQEYGMETAMKMLGLDQDSDGQNDLGALTGGGYFGNLMSNFNPKSSLARYGMNQAFQGLTKGSGMSGFGGALLPMAGIAGLAYLGNKHRLGLTGYTTQGGYEKARQDRINMKRQSNIIKTLERGKYAPGWEKTAFENVQKLGKDLNLVDAADVGLTKTRKKIRAPIHHPQHGGGGGGGGGGSTPGDQSRDPTGGSPFFRGGLAALWQR